MALQPAQPTSKTATKSTQLYLSVREVRDGVAILNDGRMSAVIMCSSINFDLKATQEQNSIIYAYQAFLNSLDFPIQIIVQSRILDLTAYIEKLKNRHEVEPNELLQLQLADYITFMRSLIEITNVMDKKFYMIISLTPPAALAKGLIPNIFPWKKGVTLSENEFNSAKQKLDERTQQAVSRLSALGIRSVPLNTQQLIELLYTSYNPEMSTSEGVSDLESMTEAVITDKKEQ